jgi:DNA-directed RNA polymerase specialized sigma24 family protein
MEASDIRAEDRETEPAEDGLSWSKLILAYRLEHSQTAATALVERLGPWLTNARKALLEAPPFADEEDVAQQLVLEVLAKAVRWQPACEDQWIPRKLVDEAERRVRKRLRRERGRQPLELDDEMPASALGEPLILDTPIGRASAADLWVIYRYHILGEPLEQMARQAGITRRQMRRRIQLAKQRARAK